MLGFNETAILILKELVISGENHRRQVIVILDEKSKNDIENEIRHKIPDPRTTRFVCRSGKPSNIYDLKICSLETCRSVIIACENDYCSLQAILAISLILKKPVNPNMHITSIVNEERNIPAMRIAGAERIETISLTQTIARIIAHSCLQPGISAVFTELFNYDGDEIYVESFCGATGMRFDQANLRFQSSTLLGIARNGTPILNPDPGTMIEKEDKLILLAADDGKSILADYEMPIDKTKFTEDLPVVRQPKKMLVLGYSSMLMEILCEEDKYLTAGSQITIALPTVIPAAYELPEIHKMKNIEISVISEDI